MPAPRKPRGGAGTIFPACGRARLPRRISLEFDYILAMDRENLVALLKRCPPEHRHKVRLYLSFSSQFEDQEVPDPYYGGSQGFERVLDMVEDAARGLLEDIRR
jgi:protein-tyrosine phosphatase